MQLNQGINLIGTLSGYAANQNNANYHTIGLTENSTDQFGSPVSTPYRIGINTANLQRIQNKLNEYKGKLVVINCHVRAVDGRNGAFLSIDANQNTDVQLIERPNEK